MGGKTQSVPSNTTQTTRAEIPAFLQPYLQSQANAGMAGVQGIQDLVNSGTPLRQLAGFTPMQQQAAGMVQNLPQGDAQGILRNALANPNGVYQGSLDQLKAIGAGDWINSQTPQFDNAISQAINGQFVPRSATNSLDSFAVSGYQLPGVSQSTLANTAAGGNLYGTPAFNEAVQASIRAAQPVVASTFAGGGQGALKGGLAQIGMQQAASDAFARLYGNERALQQQAATQLGQFGLAGRDQQINAAAQRGNLALGEQGLRNQATATLGSMIGQERGRQMQALQAAPTIGLMGVNALNSMENQNFARQMEQANALANFGTQQQQFRQAGLDASNPYSLQQMLLAASQGLPVGSLMGQSGSSTGNQTMFRNTGAGLLGGAATGLGLGALTAAPGATGLAALGGPLGIGLALGGAALGGLL